MDFPDNVIINGEFFLVIKIINVFFLALQFGLYSISFDKLTKLFSPTVLNFQTDTDMRPGSECEEPLPCDWHPRFTNVVYHKNDWNSPKNNRLLGDLIDRYYGKISYRNMITDILARSQSGRVQSAVFDVADEKGNQLINEI